MIRLTCLAWKSRGVASFPSSLAKALGCIWGVKVRGVCLQRSLGPEWQSNLADTLMFGKMPSVGWKRGPLGDRA